MRVTRRQLRRLIREAVDGSGDLGSYVFPDIKREKDRSISEPNTHLEDYLQYMLMRYFSDNVSIPRDVSVELERFANSGEYPKIFKFFKGGDVYRGMTVTKDYFESNYGKLPPKAKWYSAPIDWWKKRSSLNVSDVSLSPKTRPGYIDSMEDPMGTHTAGWSQDLKIAKEQAQISAYGKEDMIPIVLAARSSDGMFIDGMPFYAYEFQPKHRIREREVLSIGEVPVHKVYVYGHINR